MGHTSENRIDGRRGGHVRVGNTWPVPKSRRKRDQATEDCLRIPFTRHAHPPTANLKN